MTATIVGTPGTIADTASATTHTVVVPSGVAAGDAMYLQVVYAGGTTTVTGVTGLTFTQIGTRATQSGHSHYLYKLDNAAGTESGTTVTVTTSTALKVAGSLVVVRGAASSSVDSAVSNLFTTGTSHAAPTSSATGAAGDLVLTFAGDSRGASTPQDTNWTAPGTYTRAAQAFTGTTGGGASSCAVAYDFATLPASGTAVSPGNWGVDQSSVGSVWTVTVLAASGSPSASATGALTLTATAGGTAPTAAAAALTLTGTATGPGTAATGTVTITGSGASSAPAAAAGSLTLTGSAAVLSPVKRWIASNTATNTLNVAHRGSELDYPPENSLYAEQSAAAWSSNLALNVDVWQCSTGEYVASHDQNTSRVFGTAYDIPTTSWSTLSTLTANGHPIARLTDILNAITGRIFFIDNKSDTGGTALLNLLDTYGGKNYFIMKEYVGAHATADLATARGYDTWGYAYDADVSGGQLATYQSHWSLLGMDYTATTADWTAALSYGKPVIAHIVPDAAGGTTAYGKGANGLMSSKVTTNVAPTTPTGSGSLTLTGTAGAAGAGSGTATVTLTGTATAKASTSGAGAVTLAGTAGAASTAAGTGAVTLTGTAAPTVPATGTGSVTLTGAGSTTTPVTGTGSVTLTGATVVQAPASSSGTLTLSGSGTTGAFSPATGTATLTLTGSSTAQGAAGGTGTVTLTATASAATTVAGTASLTLTGTASPRAATIGAGGLTLTGTGTVATQTPASATGALTLSGTWVTTVVVQPVAVTGTTGPAVLVTGTAGAAVLVH